MSTLDNLELAIECFKFLAEHANDALALRYFELYERMGPVLRCALRGPLPVPLDVRIPGVLLTLTRFLRYLTETHALHLSR